MSRPSDRGEVVLEGTWLYANEVPCRIAIVRREIWYGTGDYEDPPSVANDREIETFEILYSTPGELSRYAAGGVQYRTLEQARAAAEVVCGNTVRWGEQRQES